MRRTRTRLAVAAVISATGLILTGCGSDNDTSDDQIQGADQGNTSTEPTNDAASDDQSEDAANRPEVELPDSFTNEYDDWESDNATEQAVLDDGRRWIDARDLAVIEQDPNADYFTFYTEDLALTSTQDWIQGFVDENVGVEGTVRYYDPEVTLKKDGSATLNYCADESDVRTYYIETGEDADADGSQVFYSTTLQENDEGVWVTTTVWSEEREVCSN